MATKASHFTLAQLLDLDRIRFPAANGVGVKYPAQNGDPAAAAASATNTDQALQAILNAIGPQPTGCRLSKKNHQRAHSPENSCWVPVTQQTRAEFRALVQELAFGKPKPRPKP